MPTDKPLEKRRWPSVSRTLLVCVRLVLIVAIVVGILRERRAAGLTREFRERVAADGSEASLVELNRLIGERMRLLREQGPLGQPARLPLVTWADSLIHGGENCGYATAALASVLDQNGQEFRVLQVNVQPATGASHIMLEAQSRDGRWILLDPLFGIAFPHPTTGRLMTIEDAQTLSSAEFEKLPADYRLRWSLQAPYRRTNWARLGPLRRVLGFFVSEQRLAEVSVRSWTVEPGYEVATCASIALALSLLWSKKRRTARRAADRGVVAASIATEHIAGSGGVEQAVE